MAKKYILSVTIFVFNCLKSRKDIKVLFSFLYSAAAEFFVSCAKTRTEMKLKSENSTAMFGTKSINCLALRILTV